MFWLLWLLKLILRVSAEYYGTAKALCVAVKYNPVVHEIGEHVHVLELVGAVRASECALHSADTLALIILFVAVAPLGFALWTLANDAIRFRGKTDIKE